MLSRVLTLNYRSLRYIDRSLGRFHVLVGPNASGKSSFLDVIDFLGDLVRYGPLRAVRERSSDLVPLTWMGKHGHFELAVEFDIPPDRLPNVERLGVQQARYEVSVGQNNAGEVVLLGENLWLKPRESRPHLPRQRILFPWNEDAPSYLVQPEGKQSPKGWRRILNKKPEAGNDYFRAETTDWNNNFRLGPSKSTLANLPEDEERFPVSLWLKELLLRGVQRIMLNSEQMRRPAPPGGSRAFQADGSNLPWVIEDLRRERPHVYEQWITHVQTALPDIDTIEAIERPEDRHRYLRIRYANGLVAPSWVVSDGTLRLLALTLIAYVQLQDRIYLIEEPENGIHPRAVEVVLQSLSSLYDSQVLCASHSPVVLSLAERESILCFARTQDGGVPNVVEIERFSSGTHHGGTLPRSSFSNEENRDEESISHSVQADQWGIREPNRARRAA